MKRHNTSRRLAACVPCSGAIYYLLENVIKSEITHFDIWFIGPHLIKACLGEKRCSERRWDPREIRLLQRLPRACRAGGERWNENK